MRTASVRLTKRELRAHMLKIAISSPPSTEPIIPTGISRIWRLKYIINNNHIYTIMNDAYNSAKTLMEYLYCQKTRNPIISVQRRGVYQEFDFLFRIIWHPPLERSSKDVRKMFERYGFGSPQCWHLFIFMINLLMHLFVLKN